MSGIKAAKALQMRLREFLGYLQEHRWIYKRAGGQSSVGYQDRVQSGDLEHKVTTITRGDGTEKVVEQVRVTPKGLAKLAKAMPPLLNGAPHDALHPTRDHPVGAGIADAGRAAGC